MRLLVGSGRGFWQPCSCLGKRNWRRLLWIQCAFVLTMWLWLWVYIICSKERSYGKGCVEVLGVHMCCWATGLPFPCTSRFDRRAAAITGASTIGWSTVGHLSFNWSLWSASLICGKVCGNHWTAKMCWSAGAIFSRPRVGPRKGYWSHVQAFRCQAISSQRPSFRWYTVDGTSQFKHHLELCWGGVGGSTWAVIAVAWC